MAENEKRLFQGVKMSFGERLAERVKLRGNPVLVGLDPRFAQLPECLRSGSNATDLAAQAACYEKFCFEIIDVVAPLVAAVKPQAAFFEQLGPAGMQALDAVVRHARKAELLVILDGKRNDIGSTAQAYADAYLGAQSAWQADALTVSPYLGADSLEPFAERCQQQDAGIFVLVKTSNPGGGHFQDVEDASGVTIYQRVAEHVESLAAASADASGFGAVGAVVGATYPEQLIELRQAMPHSWLLVPGFGAQGGSAETTMSRHFYGAAGWLAVALGLIGVLLPLLPTVPFMLLAAFCFARGSNRFHDWLVNHPQFGPAIRNWHRHGAVSRRGKKAATIAICVTFGISVVLGLPGHVLAIQAVVLVCVMAFLLTRPDGPLA